MIDPTAFIAPGAIVLGDVHLGRDASIWYNAVVRGDAERVEVGDESNIQDLSMLHADPGFPCVVGRRVSDETGITGKFDLKLEWGPEPDGPSVYTALEEQLGLRLEARKGPVPMIVIDHVERPSAN